MPSPGAVAYWGHAMNRIGIILKAIAQGKAGAILKECCRRFYSVDRFICLRRDLSTPYDPPEARIPITIRPLRDSDVKPLLEDYDPSTDWEAIRLRLRRKAFLETGIGRCYVAVTEDDVPIYMQWIIAPSDNDEMQLYFGEKFPRLKADEGLLELAFSLEACRGKRVMQNAMAQIANMGRKFGAQYMITFVDEDAVPTIKGCQGAGFIPWMRRRDVWRFFRLRAEFTAL